ncbi:Protein OSCP1 [Aphelenchoides besseyi]|nr:Protein OSCP1 [Aphelenchoides besseyi]
MSQRAMPFIFLNMAGEMAYILEQRLIVSLFKRKNRVGGYTQRVSQQRCRQVLSDVLRVVFNDKFLTKLFDPQEQYSRSSLRQYFEKMAHSSVMRLNESSMDRLFDMMTMTVKYQMLSVDEPRYLINITVNHLNGVRQIINYNPELVGSVNYAHELVTIERRG